MKEEKAGLFEVISTIIKIICVILLVLLIFVISFQRFSNNQKGIAGLRIFNVATGSMVPTYRVGDVIIVKEVDTNDLKVNDPITYMGKEGDFAGKVVTHRIVNIEETENGKIFHTQGDANDIEDPVIKADQIYGKVIYKCVIISILTKLMNNLTAFYILVFIPVGLLVFLQMKDSISSKLKDEEDDDDDDDEEDDEDEDDDDDDEDE